MAVDPMVQVINEAESLEEIAGIEMVINDPDLKSKPMTHAAWTALRDRKVELLRRLGAAKRRSRIGKR